MKDLSISIVNYNTKDFLRNCLKSIFKNTYKINYEIFVVDNASSDGSPETVEKEFLQVNLIRNKENIGFAKANNQAFKEASGSYFLLLNPDCSMKNDTLYEMVQFMNKHPEIGIAGCKIVNPNGRIEFSANRFPNLFTEFSLKFRKKLAGSNGYFDRLLKWNYNKSREVDWVSGAFLIIRSKAYREVQGMDENYFLYFEEIDLCKRVKKRGWKIYYNSNCEVLHEHGQSMVTEAEEKISRIYRTSQLYYYQKHNPFQYTLLKVYLKLQKLV